MSSPGRLPAPNGFLEWFRTSALTLAAFRIANRPPLPCSRGRYGPFMNNAG